MAQSGENLRFLAEPFPRALIVGGASREDLDGDITVEVLIMGAVYLAHSTRADFLNNIVVAKRAANHWNGTAL